MTWVRYLANSSAEGRGQPFWENSSKLTSEITRNILGFRNVQRVTDRPLTEPFPVANDGQKEIQLAEENDSQFLTFSSLSTAVGIPFIFVFSLKYYYWIFSYFTQFIRIDK